jgi:hypothetical protein
MLIKKGAELKMKSVSGEIFGDLLDYREDAGGNRGVIGLPDDGFDLFEEEVQGVSFLDRPFNVVHESPIGFHLGFQFCLQGCRVFFQLANLVTDLFLLLLYHCF